MQCLLFWYLHLLKFPPQDLLISWWNLLWSFQRMPKICTKLILLQSLYQHILSATVSSILKHVGIISKDSRIGLFLLRNSWFLSVFRYQCADTLETNLKPFLGTTDFDIEDFIILVKTSSSMPEVFLKLSGILSDLINFYSNELIPISKIISLTLCELTKNSNQQVRSRSRQILIIWFNRDGFKYFHRWNFWICQEP